MYDKTEFTLVNKWIQIEGTPVIASILSFPTKLKKLTLIESKINECGGVLLGNALGKNNTLKCLNLGDYSNVSSFTWGNWNQIGDDGVQSISNALKNNNILEELYICHQNATYKSLNLLADILSPNSSGTNRTLKILDISYNLSYTIKSFSNVRQDLKVDLREIEQVIN